MLPQRREIASVVVCEDDATTLELLCDHLAADRFGVLPAPSASDALRLCRYNHPDLLLLDLSLPDASGLDVLREIREADGVDSRFDPDLPVIVLTGRGADADRVRGLESGADDYLVEALQLPRAAGADRRGAAPRRGAAAKGPAGSARSSSTRRGARSGSASARWRSRTRSSPCCGCSPAIPSRVFTKEELLRGGLGLPQPRRAPGPSIRTPAGCGANSTPSTAATSSTAGATDTG